MSPHKVVFFSSAAHFCRWLKQHHRKKTELWVGYYRMSSGKSVMTWAESVDEALCFGWIDGIRKPLDEHRYTIRFTPRRENSVWSATNIRNVQRLNKAGRMRQSGLKAFDARVENRSEIYSYEQRPAKLPAQLADRLRRSPKASKFFNAQPSGYRKRMIWWIVSAKQEVTRIGRLNKLIAASAGSNRLE